MALAAVSGTVHLEPVTDAIASADHRFVAFTVTAHVDKALGTAGAVDVPLSVTVSQDAGAAAGMCVSVASRTDLLRLRALPELTASSRPEVSGATVTAQALQPRYSMVDLSGVGSVATFANDGSAAGSAPAILSVVSSITLPDVNADAVGPRAGPGGKQGGSTAGAGAGSGGAGSPAQTTGTGGGGGGAGAALDGGSGADGNGVGGSAGQHLVDDTISSVEIGAPSSGGGGGKGALNGGAAGGSGGGGGGVVVLAAGGDITAGMISAGGGGGAQGGTATLGLVGSGGGGGAGAGGIVVVESDTGTLKVTKINVKGNVGGPPGGGGTAGHGGSSSVGRVRWDALGGTPPSSPDRAPHRGPVFMVPSRVFRSLPQTLTLLGTRDDVFTVRVTDHDHVVHDGGRASFDQTSTAQITPPLSPGYNRICITLASGSQGRVEADKCIDVAVVR